MKVVCINNEDMLNKLTVGKCYIAKELGFIQNLYLPMYEMINDKDEKQCFLTKRFKLLETYREEQLNKLGI